VSDRWASPGSVEFCIFPESNYCPLFSAVAVIARRRDYGSTGAVELIEVCGDAIRTGRRPQLESVLDSDPRFVHDRAMLASEEMEYRSDLSLINLGTDHLIALRTVKSSENRWLYGVFRKYFQYRPRSGRS
jgi:hypothetical protein